MRGEGSSGRRAQARGAGEFPPSRPSGRISGAPAGGTRRRPQAAGISGQEVVVMRERIAAWAVLLAVGAGVPLLSLGGATRRPERAPGRPEGRPGCGHSLHPCLPHARSTRFCAAAVGVGCSELLCRLPGGPQHLPLFRYPRPTTRPATDAFPDAERPTPNQWEAPVHGAPGGKPPPPHLPRKREPVARPHPTAMPGLDDPLATHSQRKASLKGPSF